MKIRKALIIGGGIGGLSAATALRNAGIAVDVAEINRSWKIYHTGIVVQGNFIRAMAALGIADEAVAIGFPYEAVQFQDLHGNLIRRLKSERVAGPQYPARLGMTRPALHEVLNQAAAKRGANIRLGTTYTKLEQHPDHVSVTFTDGSTENYDLVIGADGVYSKVRAELFGEQYKAKFTGQGTWRCNVPRPPELDHGIITMGMKDGKCGFIPLDQKTGYVWLVQAEPGNPFFPEDQLADIFRARIAECTGIMGQLREHITDPKKVVYRPLEALLMPKPWYKGRILLMGDAAHATTPHMGQGAAQAVEDGVTIGEIFQQDAPIDQLMEAFQNRRYERCKFIVEASLQIGEWEMNPSPSADPVGLTAKMFEVTSAPI